MSIAFVSVVLFVCVCPCLVVSVEEATYVVLAVRLCAFEIPYRV